MSLCRTCEYALYDGMCMAHGKFTLLDAPACDDYKMHLDVEVSKLKAENAKLREQLADVTESMGRVEERCAKLRELIRDMYEMAYPEYPSAFEAAFAGRLHELGVEVDDGTE